MNDFRSTMLFDSLRRIITNPNVKAAVLTPCYVEVTYSHRFRPLDSLRSLEAFDSHLVTRVVGAPPLDGTRGALSLSKGEGAETMSEVFA